jgi:FHS family L-fucose permease-like MFS transporter
MAMAVAGSSVKAANAPLKNNNGAMAMVTTLFFTWGFITCLNDILIPHLKSIFDLNYFEVMFVQFCFFTSYFVFSLPSGKLVEWVGYKRSMVTGLLTMAVGAVLFVPAALVPSFPLFLVALIVISAGMTLLQVSANPYVAILGPERTASSRLNLTQAFNSLGTTIAPAIGAFLILGVVPKGMDEIRAMAPAALHAYRVQEASSVKLPYLAITGALILLALAIAMFNLPRMEMTRDFRIPKDGIHQSIWKFRHTVLGAASIFCYVGAEVSIGSFLVNYLSQPEIGGVRIESFIHMISQAALIFHLHIWAHGGTVVVLAAQMVALYWGGAMVGRFIGSAVLRKVSPGRVLGIVALVAGLLVLVSMTNTGSVAMWSILLVGLFNSIMFPTAFALAVAGLGPLTGKASGLLLTAAGGGAVIPLLQGKLIDTAGYHISFIVPALCYLWIVFYGFRGSRVRMA